MKNIKDSCLVLIFILAISGCRAEDPCVKYSDKSAEQISTLLESMDTVSLSHELYILGECKISNSVPALEPYTSDVRITHHALHKGMTIGHIARGSIKKIKK